MSKADTKGYKFWQKWMEENEWEYDNFPMDELLEAYHKAELERSGLLKALVVSVAGMKLADEIEFSNEIKIAEKAINKLKQDK